MNALLGDRERDANDFYFNSRLATKHENLFSLCQWGVESRSDKLQIYSIQIVNCSRRDIFNEAYFTFSHYGACFGGLNISSSNCFCLHAKTADGLRAKSIEQETMTTDELEMNAKATRTTTTTNQPKNQSSTVRFEFFSRLHFLTSIKIPNEKALNPWRSAGAEISIKDPSEGIKKKQNEM